jgi:hypothetical protein
MLLFAWWSGSGTKLYGTENLLINLPSWLANGPNLVVTPPFAPLSSKTNQRLQQYMTLRLGGE